MKNILLSLLALVGLSQASTDLSHEKLKAVAQVTEDTPLMLEHSKIFQASNENIEVAYHYSHSSHESHGSHTSHYSSR